MSQILSPALVCPCEAMAGEVPKKMMNAVAPGAPPPPAAPALNGGTIEMNTGNITEIDIVNLRPLRQEINNDQLMTLLNNDTLSRKNLENVCNLKEFDRMLKDISKQLGTEFTLENFHNKCKIDPIYRYSIVPRISINSTRQGSKDEKTILTICNNSTSKHGVIIKQIPNDSLRAHKHSNKLISKDEYKKGKGEYKQNDCLKSFDATVYSVEGSGKEKKGFIFAKVCMGGGGHQDNVFDEAHCFGEWADKYGEDGMLYIILIDTDQIIKFKELEEKYKNHSKVYVVDHMGIQRLLIN